MSLKKTQAKNKMSVDREKLHAHTLTYMYIYIYIERERERKRTKLVDLYCKIMEEVLKSSQSSEEHEVTFLLPLIPYPL